MSGSTRREFLKASAIAGCGLCFAPPALMPAYATATPARLAISRWDPAKLGGAELVSLAQRLTESAIAALGGMKRFVKPGDVVWLKPNIGWNRRPELAANTNPDVVGTLVRLCLQAGAKAVKVGDHPCHPARQAYRNSGISAAVEAAGGQIVYLDKKRFRETKLGGEHLDGWPLYVEAIEADLLINIPVVKHHGLTQVSAAMKNYMGIIGGRRAAWHQNMPGCVSDITRFMKPRLTVIDAVRVLKDHGPQGGDPADVLLRGVVAAGTDIVALDSFGATLLGHRPAAVETIAKAARAGLGTTDFQSLEPVEQLLS